MSTAEGQIFVRKATVEDLDNILDITRNEFLWNGLDYLPFALKNWLEESNQVGTNRENIVFLLDDLVVGFESFYFQDGGNIAARFSFRVKQELRGKGLGREMLEIQFKYLKKHFPNVVYSLSAIPDIALPDEAFQSTKFGELLAKRPVVNIRIDLNTYKFPDLSADCLTVLDKNQFRALLQDGGFSRLTGSKLLHMNWVPILLNTKEDVEFAVRKDARVIVEGDPSAPLSMSVLSSPLQCPAGIRGSIDLFAYNNKSCAAHIKYQLRKMVEIVEARSQEPEARCLTVQMYLHETQLETARDTVKLLGLGDSMLKLGDIDRDVDHMYIYKQQI